MIFTATVPVLRSVLGRVFLDTIFSAATGATVVVRGLRILQNGYVFLGPLSPNRLCLRQK